jgi:GGDEF domain-containing protein
MMNDGGSDFVARIVGEEFVVLLPNPVPVRHAASR